ncbi:MAG: hypothetical protein R3B82_10120 [Sandaracinaceae bacterium]
MSGRWYAFIAGPASATTRAARSQAEEEAREREADVTEAELAGVGALELHPRLRVVAELPEVVEQQVRDHLDTDLGALLLEEALQVVVPVALGGHRPELAEHRDARLGPQAIHLDLREDPAAAPDGREDRGPVLERPVDLLLRGGDGAIRVALVDLVGAEPVADEVDDVAGDQRLADRDEERLVEDQAELLAGRLFHPAGLLEEQHAEAVEARVAERLAVLGDVHPERQARRRRRSGRGSGRCRCCEERPSLVAEPAEPSMRFPTVK